MNAAASRVADWIRPWYPAGPVAHLSPHCPELLRIETEPREGSGWLNPHTSDTCQTCLDQHGYASWHAECKTCGACIGDDYTSRSYVSEADAKAWEFDHECEPQVVIEAPPKPPAPAQPEGQGALFPPADLTAVEAAA
jgi:hypothetical protein